MTATPEATESTEVANATRVMGTGMVLANRCKRTGQGNDAAFNRDDDGVQRNDSDSQGHEIDGGGQYDDGDKKGNDAG
jgi:hypothetical protein